MYETQALELVRHAILTAMKLMMPVLLVSLVVGVLISLFQAVTSIQEQTLTFVPKVIVVSLTLVFLGPWMLHTLVSYTSEMLKSLPSVIKP